MTEPVAAPAMHWPAALNAELLILPQRAEELRESWLRLDGLEAAERARGFGAPEPDATRYRVINGAAVIPIVGVLINRGNYLGEYGITSYPALAREIQNAAGDPNVNRIVLAIDSPGGMASGLDAAEDAIIAARAQKPVVASVTGMAASAAYWLASQADEIAVSRRSEVGSIGVYTMHLDISKALADFGLNVSLIYSGRHKVDGHPFAPLPDDVRAAFQSRIDGMRLSFARAVGTGRPKLGVGGAMATEARMYSATDADGSHFPALEHHLADSIATLEHVLSTATQTRAPTRGATMSQNETAPGGTAPGIAQADHDRAVTAAREAGRAEGHAAGLIEGRAEGQQTGATEAATRISSILDHAAAQGRETLARHLAFKTTMSVADAVATLEASPKAAAPAKPTLGQQMEGEQRTDLGAAPPPPGGQAGGMDAYEKGRLITLKAKGKPAA